MATPDCFVHDMVKPWLLPGGWPDYEQSGRVRWFLRGVNDVLVFFERHEDALEHAAMLARHDSTLEHLKPMSLAVIHARTEENAELMRAMPDYLSKIAQGDRVTRMRMQGCWEARPASAGMFDRQWYQIFEKLDESQVKFSCRGWDLAATKPSEENDDPDWTRGVREDLLGNGIVVLSDIASLRDNPGPVDDLIMRTAAADGPKVTQAFWIDPGATGIRDEAHIRAKLATVRGCGPVVFEREVKNKEAYAKPMSAYADKTKDTITPGLAVVRAAWNGQYFAEAEEFPRDKNSAGIKNKKDQIDASSRAWIEVEKRLRRTNSWMEAMRRV
jgi:phage terminase large subunit-like protein